MAVLEELTLFFMAIYHAILNYACRYMVSRPLSQYQERHYPIDELFFNLTQFVISSVVQDINAEILAKTFMEEVALSFGMAEVIVVDADRIFRSFF